MTTGTQSADLRSPFERLAAVKPDCAALIKDHLPQYQIHHQRIDKFHESVSRASNDTDTPNIDTLNIDSGRAPELEALQACHQEAKTQPNYNPFELTTAFYDAINAIPRGVFIGDIQGELGMLVHFISWLETAGHLTPNNTPMDHVVLLGDMISRGEDSCGVISYVQNYLRKNYHCTFIMGNAEARILNMRTDLKTLPTKDLSVIQSYFPGENLQSDAIDRMDFLYKLQRLNHADFFKALTACTRIGPYIFSHSGDLPYKLWQATINIETAIKDCINEDVTRFYYNNGDPKQFTTLSLFNPSTMQRYYQYQRHHQALGFTVIFGHVTLPLPEVIYHQGAIQAVGLDTDVNGIANDPHYAQPRKMLSGFLPHLQHTFSVVQRSQDKAYNAFFRNPRQSQAMPFAAPLLSACENTIGHYQATL